MKRILLSVTLSLCLLITGFSTVLASNNAGYTPQDYVNYLTEKGKTDPEMLRVKEQFLKLSAQKKKKFLYYITNSDTVNKMLSLSVPAGSKRTLFNGDVVIEHNSEVTEKVTADGLVLEKKSILSKTLGFMNPINSVEAAPVVKEHSLRDERASKAFGITVGTFTSWVKYKSRGQTVTSIIAGGGSYSNGYPMTTISQQSCDKYIYGNKAHTAIVWSVKIGFPLINYTGTVHHHILGFGNGSKTYRFWKEF